MEWLNYHHLLYFWAVAKNGSVTAACKQLGLAQPTVSGQIRALEESLGEKLFTRAGRGLALTEVGRTVYGYAEEIFALGRELQDTVRGRSIVAPTRLVVGIADVVPKLVAYRLLEPALRFPKPIQIVCHEGKPERLLGDLAVHSLDIVLSDAPIGANSPVKAYSHLLGESTVSIFGAPSLAKRARRNFPASLDEAPFLQPLDDTGLRGSLDVWFATRGIRPRIVGQVEDSALLVAFAQAGAGLFAAPSVIESELLADRRLVRVGRLDGLRERYYAISVERRLKHPAVVAISNAARSGLFKSK